MAQPRRFSSGHEIARVEAGSTFSSSTTESRPANSYRAERGFVQLSGLHPLVLHLAVRLVQAQPLHRAYPATAPSVGDYLTVDDTLPRPAPNRGYYYVTAVNYQGQRRYGRQSNGGVLSGRDPAVLPGCS